MDPLIVDVFEGDAERVGAFDWSKLVAAGPPWHGAIIKATQGTYYAPTWFYTNWSGIKSAAGERFGVDFFRGCYHYWSSDTDGDTQADYFLDFVDRAGGWDDGGDFAPIVDVEKTRNERATKQQVVDGVSKFAERCQARTGRAPILYGRSFLYELGITEHMGCNRLWVALYAAQLPARNDRFGGYEDIGWSLDELFAWQYCGDGESYLAGYPATSPIGAVDISALLLDGGGSDALAAAANQGGTLKRLAAPALALGLGLGLTHGLARFIS